MKKSKIVITSILSVFGVSLLAGATIAEWAVTDNADPFSIVITVDVPKVAEGYYLTFESDNYLVSGAKTIKMSASGSNVAQTTSVSISNTDKVRIYHYDGDTVENTSSLTTYSLPDAYGYVSLGGDSSTLTFNTSRSGNSFSFYLNNENKLYLVDETYNSYDGYYISYSTNSGSTWCSFADAIHMSDTSGDNVAEYTGSFNSNYIYKIEHFSGTKGIISSAKLQGGTYTHFTNSAADSASLSFKESTSYKLMLSAGDDKIYIQKPSASSLSGYYIFLNGNTDYTTAIKMDASVGNHGEYTFDVAANTSIRIAEVDAVTDVTNTDAYATLGRAESFVNQSVGSSTITFNKADKYTIYLNTSDKVFIDIASMNTVYFNDGGSDLWGIQRTSKMIYFTMPNNGAWSRVYAYAWDESGSNGNNSPWPGVAATYVKDNDYGQKIYRYEVDEKYNYVIFNNNGSKQTSNISLSGVDDCSQYYVNNNDSGDVTKIKYSDPRAEYGLLYAWVWETTESCGHWEELASSSTKPGYYEMTIHSYETNVKFARCAYTPTDYSSLSNSDVVWNNVQTTVPGDGYAYTITSWSGGSWSGAAI